jgi:hypothetical protein
MQVKRLNSGTSGAMWEGTQRGLDGAEVRPRRAFARETETAMSRITLLPEREVG